MNDEEDEELVKFFTHPDLFDRAPKPKPASKALPDCTKS